MKDFILPFYGCQELIAWCISVEVIKLKLIPHYQISRDYLPSSGGNWGADIEYNKNTDYMDIDPEMYWTIRQTSVLQSENETVLQDIRWNTKNNK